MGISRTLVDWLYAFWAKWEATDNFEIQWRRWYGKGNRSRIPCCKVYVVDQNKLINNGSNEIPERNKMKIEELH